MMLLRALTETELPLDRNDDGLHDSPQRYDECTGIVRSSSCIHTSSIAAHRHSKIGRDIDIFTVGQHKSRATIIEPTYVM